jgi:RND family efflux transporter MFP subunit
MKHVALVAALFAAACSGRATTGPQPEPPIAVSAARVAMAEAADTFEAGGVVQARTTATLTARILAPVLEVRVAPGDRVRAGQVLVVLDGAALSAQARGARAAATAADQAAAAAVSEQQAAEASLTLARATYERIAGLHARRSATSQELDTATSTLRAAEARAAGSAAHAKAAAANVDSARGASDAAGTTAAFATITAPFAGVVTEKMVEPGNMAAPGAPLVRLEDTRGFRLDVRVDAARVGTIAPGQAVPVTLDGNDGRTVSITGTVSEVARAIDADARAFLVKISLPATETARSGAFGRARFEARTRRALHVPEAALVRRGQLTSVFVVENGVARLRLLNVSGTEVLAGLSEGETVILAPPAGVTDGRRVSTGAR